MWGAGQGGNHRNWIFALFLLLLERLRKTNFVIKPERKEKGKREKEQKKERRNEKREDSRENDSSLSLSQPPSPSLVVFSGIFNRFVACNTFVPSCACAFLQTGRGECGGRCVVFFINQERKGTKKAMLLLPLLLAASTTYPTAPTPLSPFPSPHLLHPMTALYCVPARWHTGMGTVRRQAGTLIGVPARRLTVPTLCPTSGRCTEGHRAGTLQRSDMV